MKTVKNDAFFELGFEMQKKLGRVRGVRASHMDWCEFSKLPEFQSAVKLRKFSVAELERFQRGFESARSGK